MVPRVHEAHQRSPAGTAAPAGALPATRPLSLVGWGVCRSLCAPVRPVPIPPSPQQQSQLCPSSCVPLQVSSKRVQTDCEYFKLHKGRQTAVREI